MKILFVLNNYSGLEESLSSCKWRPAGMPAVTKLFDGLTKKNINFDVVFINRSGNLNRTVFSNVKFINFPKSSFSIIGTGCQNSGNFIIKFIKRHLFEIQLSKKIKRILNRKRYDILYCDRANVAQGALAVAYNREKVILRLHGVSFNYQKFKKLRFYISKFVDIISYKSKFSHVICTLEGGPAELFLKRYLSSDTPYSILLNGVDKGNYLINNSIYEKYMITDDCPVVLFTGRLEDDKNILKFVEVVLELRMKGVNSHVFIVGNGSYYEYVKNTFSNDELTHVIGHVNHDEIYKFYEIADIFVSLNKIGNLCNTVLESIRSGCCVITFDSDNKNERDVSTKSFLNDCAIFVNRCDMVNEVVMNVVHLSNNRKTLSIINRKTLAFGRVHLDSWDTRIQKEISLFESISKKSSN
jgi:glycosyltransferase involved in cell wall biosynthesis